MHDVIDIEVTPLSSACGAQIKGVDLTNPREAATKLAIGTRVVTKFAEQRKGDVLDFWFEPG